MADPRAADSPPSSVSTTQESSPEPPPVSGLSRPRAWPRLPAWTRSATLHEWIRSGGILIAAAWGVYTFVWKDILVPSWQPAYLSLEASLTPVSGRPAGADGQEMTLEVKGTNASSRRVYLLPNVWWVSGIQRKPSRVSTAGGTQSFLQEANQALEGVALMHAERSVPRTPRELIAVGRLFDDNFLDPGAALQRTILMRIPPGYEAAELKMIVPLLTRQPDRILNNRKLVWHVNDPLEDPLPMICPKVRSNSNSAIKTCQTFDRETERVLQHFDSRKSTIVLQMQIGLPLDLR